MQIAHRDHLPIKAIAQELSDRSSVFAVSFCYLFSIAPHFKSLPIWVIGFVLAALTWRMLQAIGKIRQMPKWLLIPLVFIGGIGVFAEYWTIIGRDAGLALFCVMTSFKILESRNHRDMLILIFLCYFLIATHFLFSQSIITAVLMMITLVVITSTLIKLNQRDDSNNIVHSLKTSGRLIAASMPLMLILFILVPRIPGPLWGLTNEQRGGITGLSDEMSPGKISNLIQSNEVAFRVEFEGEVPSQSKLYWRGPVMARFNGHRWSQVQHQALNILNLSVYDEATRYTITLEPNGEKWLLALDIPTKLVDNSFMTTEFQLTNKTKINDLLRYSLESRLSYSVGVQESADYLDVSLSFPEELNPQTVDFGRELARQYSNPEDIIKHVLAMFREQEFVYTLKPPFLTGDVVDEFLFSSKKGFCEHYAGSFALLMRAAGIPSRVVTGYQGGEFNQQGNYLIVRQSDAHAWTEVWIEGKGWVRIDPTGAVAPGRIEHGLDDIFSSGLAGFRIQNSNPLFGKLLFSWDNLQHSWNDWVLDYDQRKQMDFLKKLNLGINNWSDMVFALVITLTGLAAFYWFISWYRQRPSKPAIYEIQFNCLLKKLAKAGIAKAAAEDSRHFLRRLVAKSHYRVDQQLQFGAIIELYNRIKYGHDATDEKAHKRFAEMISALRI